MTKNYFIIGLCIALAICVFFLLQPDKQHDIHDNDKKEVVADHYSLKAHGVEYARIDDSLKKDNERLIAEVNTLRQGQSLTRRQLDLKSAEVRNLAKEVQRNNHDTGEQAWRIDSLVERVESLTFLLGQYEDYADSINVKTDSIQAGCDTRISEKDKRIVDLQAAYDKLYKAYNTVWDTNKGLAKSLKRQKLKTKIAAVLGAVGAVLLISK